MDLLQFAVPRKNTNITQHGERVPKNVGKPMTLQHSRWMPPPLIFLIYAQFWLLHLVFSHTHSRYISKVWQYDPSTVKWGKNDLMIHIEMNQQKKNLSNKQEKDQCYGVIQRYKDYQRQSSNLPVASTLQCWVSKWWPRRSKAVLKVFRPTSSEGSRGSW